MSVGYNDNRQTDRQIYSSQNAQTYIKSAQIKWDRKAVLGVHVLNPGMMSVGDNDNRQIDRHIYSREKGTNLYRVLKSNGIEKKIVSSLYTQSNNGVSWRQLQHMYIQIYIQ